jgi:hypothetical protein
MQATVTKVDNQYVRAIVRRNYRDEAVQGKQPDLKVGDKIQVRRQVNNPFLVRVVAPTNH